jgi:mycoredoxin
LDSVTIYSTTWCPDCRRAKDFLKERGVSFVEINIEDDPDAEDLVLKVNQGRCKVPTIKVGDRYFACSPFSAQKLASELDIPLNR